MLFLTGDLGFMAVEPFAERFPDRFINVGVAEQNMIGLATGLAEAGFLPFAYSIAPFASLRPYEFIRNGPILHQLPVRIAGIGGGFEYGTAGPTHYGVDDVGALRVQPGLTIIAPADHLQTRTALLDSWDLPGPVYYRLGKDDKAVVPGLNGQFTLGRAQWVRRGGDMLLIAMGAVATEAAAAAQELHQQGVECGVLVVASVAPAPYEDLAEALSTVPVALTVEAHYRVGGLGSIAADVIAEQGIRCRLIRHDVSSPVGGASGSQTYLQQRHGLSCSSLVASALGALAGAAP